MQAAELGQTLREAREAQQISIDDVSRALSLRVAVIEALESGDYREIGALLYAKNHLRKYVDYLGLDQAKYSEIIQNLQEGVDPFAQGILKSSRVKRQAESKKKHLTLKYYVGFVIFVLAGIFLLVRSGVIPLPSPLKGGWEIDLDEKEVLQERLPSLEFEHQESREKYSRTTTDGRNPVGNSAEVEQDSPYYLEDSVLESLQRAEQSLGEHETLVEDQSIEKVETNFETLGGATRYYAALIDQTSLPKIDLAHDRKAPKYTLAENHPLYLYLNQRSERLGPGIYRELNEELTAQSRAGFSIYDQSLGLWEFLRRTLTSGYRIDDERWHVERASEEEAFRIALDEALEAGKISDIEYAEEMNRFVELREAEEAARIEFREEFTESHPVEFRFSANDLTTLEIIDAEGEVLTSRILRGGEEYRLQALGSFDIQLGNPQAIEKISADGDEIPSFRYKPATEGATVMRFSLNSEEYR